jgi:hypothetical protein
VEIPTSYSQSPPLAEKDWPTSEEISSVRLAPNPEDRADLRSGRRPLAAPINRPQSSSYKDSELERGGPSLAGRVFRSLIRFSIAVLIGVGATLGWQSYGDMAKEMITARAPGLAWLLSISTTKPPVVAATSPDPAQQLGPLVFNLDFVRRSVEQIAAKQEEMAQDIAMLQSVEEDIRKKMSFTPPSEAPQAPPVQQQRPLQPRVPPSAVQSSSVRRSPAPTGPQLSR